MGQSRRMRRQAGNIGERQIERNQHVRWNDYILLAIHFG
jgi:hypothetical protein